MIKKLLLAGTITGALATLALIAQPVSANYYDCNGNLHTGNPRPSECHYFLTPARSSSSNRNRAGVITNTESNSASDRSRANIVKESESSSTSSSSNRSRAGVVTNTGSTSYKSTGRSRAGIVTEIGRNYSDLEESRNRENAIIVNDPDNYSKKYEVRNARKYCTRNYCYIVYDYCYDLTHCERKVQKEARKDYQQEDNWMDMFEDYYNRYKNNHCDHDQYGRSRCIYRGFHFGGYHNGYWYY